MEDLTLKDLKIAQCKANEKALRLNRALGLPFLEVQNSQLVSVDPEGRKTVLGEARFGLRKINRKRFRLDDQ